MSSRERGKYGTRYAAGSVLLDRSPEGGDGRQVPTFTSGPYEPKSQPSSGSPEGSMWCIDWFTSYPSGYGVGRRVGIGVSLSSTSGEQGRAPEPLDHGEPEIPSVTFSTSIPSRHPVPPRFRCRHEIGTAERGTREEGHRQSRSEQICSARLTAATGSPDLASSTSPLTKRVGSGRRAD